MESDPFDYGKADTNFHDVRYKDDEDDTAGLCFTLSNTCTQNQAALHYSVFYPSDYADYATCPLPVVFVIHGGDFFD